MNWTSEMPLIHAFWGALFGILALAFFPTMNSKLFLEML